MNLPSVSIKAYRRVAMATVVAITVLIGTGGWVRLSQSGLGCTTWPKCTSSDFVAPGGYHSLVEFSNRVATIGLGVVIGLAVLGALLHQPRRRSLVILSLALVAGYLGEAVLGGITVLTKLNPFLVATHLILALILLATALALQWRVAGHDQDSVFVSPPKAVQRLVKVMMAAFWTTVVFGTVVTGTGPHSGNPGTPRFHFVLADVALIEAIAGALLGLSVIAMVYVLRRAAAPRHVQVRAQVALGTIVVEGVLGAIVWYSHFSVWVIEAHVVGAALTMIAMSEFIFTVIGEDLPLPGWKAQERTLPPTRVAATTARHN